VSRSGGLPVVVEGQRINFKVYRRIFAPVQRVVDGETYVLYNDTGREREISYSNADYYGLDNPLNRVRLYKLAKAMNCLVCVDSGQDARDCTVTICLTRELSDAYTEEAVWTPFDPSRLEPLEERLERLHRRALWRRRVKG
jgi:hypothetical protein